jgi:hypothetical protein
MIELDKDPTELRESWTARVRSGTALLDGLVLALLGALLLPLIVGPFWLAYSFALDGEYAAACFVGSLFGLFALVAIRAVRRGEFGPGVLGLALALLGGLFVLAKLFSR